MKQVSLLLLVFCLIAWTPLFSQTRAEKKAAKEALIKNKIESGNFTIEISKIFPQKHQERRIYGGYYVRFNDGDRFSSSLPYIGNTNSAVFGTQDLSVSTHEQKVNIQKGYDASGGYYFYTFTFINESITTKWQCSIVIYTDGAARVLLENNGRDSISYTGDLQIEKENSSSKDSKKK